MHTWQLALRIVAGALTCVRDPDICRAYTHWGVYNISISFCPGTHHRINLYGDRPTTVHTWQLALRIVAGALTCVRDPDICRAYTHWGVYIYINQLLSRYPSQDQPLWRHNRAHVAASIVGCLAEGCTLYTKTIVYSFSGQQRPTGSNSGSMH